MKSFAALFCLVLALASATSAPLQEARINKIINEVSVVDPANGSRRAELQQVIKDTLGVKTGIKSRSELVFQDNTLTRLGPETYFSFTAGTRDMALREGTMLLQVPKGQGGAKIRTAAITAAITGTTIMLEHRAGKHVKVVVLEGSLRLSVNGTFGDSLVLTPGKMVIMPPNAKRIPDPVSVDLAKLVKTSSLVQLGEGEGGALPSLPLIEQEIATQTQQKENNSLVETNLLIAGSGTHVVLADDKVLAALNKKASADPRESFTVTHVVPASSSGTVSPDPVTGGSVPDPVEAGGGSTPAAVDDDADDDDSIYSRVTDVEGRSTDPVNVTTPVELSPRERNAKVRIRARGTITVASRVQVSDTTSSRGGRITIEGRKENGTAISITSSGELLSLLAPAAPGPGGVIRLRSRGGAINVAGNVRADRGTIDIRNDGHSGAIDLSNATLNASTIKVRTLGRDGQLTIGGGTITADTLIDLYAGGSNGTVRFTDNVTLSGNSVKTITGHTVRIDNGKVVNVQGPTAASVFTNNPQYTGSGGNGATTGAFGGQGATTQPLSAAPGR